MCYLSFSFSTFYTLVFFLKYFLILFLLCLKPLMDMSLLSLGCKYPMFHPPCLSGYMFCFGQSTLHFFHPLWHIMLAHPSLACEVSLCVWVLSHFSHVRLCDPMDCSPLGSSVHGDSPGKNAGVDCHFLLQGIFHGSNLCLLYVLHWQADSLPLSHLEKSKSRDRE